MVSSCLIMFLVMFLPRSRQLVAMGKEDFFAHEEPSGHHSLHQVSQSAIMGIRLQGSPLDCSQELLCQQFYAIKNQLFASSLVLYGIMIVEFHARKDPIIGAIWP